MYVIHGVTVISVLASIFHKSEEMYLMTPLFLLVRLIKDSETGKRT